MTEDELAVYTKELQRIVAEYQLVTRVTILFSVLIQAFLAQNDFADFCATCTSKTRRVLFWYSTPLKVIYLIASYFNPIWLAYPMLQFETTSIQLVFASVYDLITGEDSTAIWPLLLQLIELSVLVIQNQSKQGYIEAIQTLIVIYVYQY